MVLVSATKIDRPSAWVRKHAVIVPQGDVLDLACGGGRNGRLFLKAGHPVTFMDKDTSKVSDLHDSSVATIMEYDLEQDAVWPFLENRFSSIVVVNYLYRPLFDKLVKSLSSGGILIYQTFAEGNENYGRPRNPDFLLKLDELLLVFGGVMQVIDFEQGFQSNPDRVIQSICAQKL